MENVRKLEVVVAGWYKDVPHLPKNAQKWLAENIWWLALVGVVLGALSIFALISATFFASAVLVGYGGAAGAVIGGFALIAVLASLAVSAASLVVTGVAITPLKAMRKKGWMLLFIVLLLGLLGHVVAFLFYFNFFGLVWDLLFTAVGGYFLFEIRDLFGATKSKEKTKPATTA